MNAVRRPIPILDLRPGYAALKPEIDAAIARVLEDCDFIMGKDVREFEREAAKYLGTVHAIGVNSGTDALVISLKALGIGPGHEVITTPFSFFATAEAIAHAGAEPVFVDIDPRTFNLDVEQIASAVTERTRAVLPVHLFGRPLDMAKLSTIADTHGLLVIEDCAQSFGARLSGKQTGSFGNAGAFSFFPSKTLGAFGDGGLIATDDGGVAELARSFRTHGSLKKYHNERVGFNSRLDTLQAAVLRVKLPYVDACNAARRTVASHYNELLHGIDGIVIPEISEGHVFHQYTIRITGGRRDAVKARLADAGISTMVYYPVPIDRLPLYEGRHTAFPHSAAASAEVLSLPIWPELDPETQDVVVTELRAAFSRLTTIFSDF